MERYYNAVTNAESDGHPSGTLSGSPTWDDLEAAGWVRSPIVRFVAPVGTMAMLETRRIEMRDGLPVEIMDVLMEELLPEGHKLKGKIITRSTRPVKSWDDREKQIEAEINRKREAYAKWVSLPVEKKLEWAEDAIPENVPAYVKRPPPDWCKSAQEALTTETPIEVEP